MVEPIEGGADAVESFSKKEELMQVDDEAMATKKEDLYVCQLEHDEALLVCLLEELMQVEYSRVEMSRAE